MTEIQALKKYFYDKGFADGLEAGRSAEMKDVVEIINGIFPDIDFRGMVLRNIEKLGEE